MYEVPDTEEALRRGEYTVIRSLIRVLEVSVHIVIVNIIKRVLDMTNVSFDMSSS